MKDQDRDQRLDSRITFRVTEDQLMHLKEQIQRKNISSISKYIRNRILESYTDKS